METRKRHTKEFKLEAARLLEQSGRPGAVSRNAERSGALLFFHEADGPVPLPGPFVRFIGVAEVLGGIGVILIGATVITLVGGDVAPAPIPPVVGLLSAFVAYGRRRLAPHSGSSFPV
jgi:hypothetical protein